MLLVNLFLTTWRLTLKTNSTLLFNSSFPPIINLSIRSAGCRDALQAKEFGIMMLWKFKFKQLMVHSTGLTPQNFVHPNSAI